MANKNPSQTTGNMSDDDFDIDAAIAEAVKGVENWVDEQVGFPPYWNPTEGKKFAARVMARDERDLNFVRYVLQALHLTPCQNGPADDAEQIKVKKDEFFTISDYSGLPLHEFFGEVVIVEALRKRKLAANEANPQKRDLWVWSVKVSPETKKKLAEKRKSTGQYILTGGKRRIEAGDQAPL